MLNKLTATQKGLVTGLAMIAAVLLCMLAKLPQNGVGQYLAYFIYTAGVVWTLVVFGKTTEHKNTFKEFFNEGFKCFIVITLLMVVFTFVFSKFNTTYRDAYADVMRAALTKKGNYTPAEIDKQVSSMKSNFAITITSGAIFFYLIIGALVAAVTSAFITRNKN
jgi:glucan phosphoethanolaminetransferase (alkaline phosphatase superfamily)